MIVGVCIKKWCKDGHCPDFTTDASSPNLFAEKEENPEVELPDTCGPSNTSPEILLRELSHWLGGTGPELSEGSPSSVNRAAV